MLFELYHRSNYNSAFFLIEKERGKKTNTKVKKKNQILREQDI
jgi:hypothetical protein